MTSRQLEKSDNIEAVRNLTARAGRIADAVGRNVDSISSYDDDGRLSDRIKDLADAVIALAAAVKRLADVCDQHDQDLLVRET